MCGFLSTRIQLFDRLSVDSLGGCRNTTQSVVLDYIVIDLNCTPHHTARRRKLVRDRAQGTIEKAHPLLPAVTSWIPTSEAMIRLSISEGIDMILV